MGLRDALIKLGSQNPDLQGDLESIIDFFDKKASYGVQDMVAEVYTLMTDRLQWGLAGKDTSEGKSIMVFENQNHPEEVEIEIKRSGMIEYPEGSGEERDFYVRLRMGTFQVERTGITRPDLLRTFIEKNMSDYFGHYEDPLEGEKFEEEF